MVLGPGLACRLVRRLRPRLPLGPAAQASLALVLGPGLACAAWSPRCYLAQAYACCLLAYHTQMGLHMRGILMARGHLGRACGRASKLVRRGAAHGRCAAAAASGGAGRSRPSGHAPALTRRLVGWLHAPRVPAFVANGRLVSRAMRLPWCQTCACVAHGACVAQACGPTIRACVAHGFDTSP